MASLPHVGRVSDSDFIRDSTLGFFIGSRFVESSPHRFCFTVSSKEKQLTPMCSVCDLWKECKRPWREAKL